MAAKEPLIVIVGQTSSGKSVLAIDLAKRFGGEIICADSWTVYKGFDIGTAKPNNTDQQQVEHHMIDVAEPDEGFSAALFKDMAIEAIDTISRRGKLAILTGGTGLYIDSVLFNYSFLPSGDTTQRKILNDMSLKDIQELVKSSDIDTEGIDVNNKRRLIRLYENAGIRPKKTALRQDTLIIGVSRSKVDLEQSIKLRVINMLDSGLEDEVCALVSRYGWDIEPMKGIGYREFRPYFEGACDLEAVRQAIVRNTLLLAKKQATWFKRNKSIHWVQNREDAVDLVTTFVNKYK